jgi:hypothetical protein
MNKKDYQKPSIWVMRFQFPQSPLLASQNGIRGTREDYDTETEEDWDESKNSSIWNN